MLASRRMNITKYSKDLPNEINKLIEDYTEITFSIIIDDTDNQNGIRVKLINVFNNEVLEEIYLDDAVDNKIKLSSDGTKVVYLDNNINMSYYDINTKTKNKIELSLSSLTTENTKKLLFFNNGVPKFYYFDRNGLYFIIVGDQKTHIIDVMNRTVSDEIPWFALIIDEIELFSSDYKRVFLGTNSNYFSVMDYLTGDEIYHEEVISPELCLGCTDKNMNYIITGNKTTKEIIIKNINNSNIIFNYNEENVNNIRGMIFEKNLLIMHFENYIKIVNIKNNKITQIDNLIENLDDCVIELIDEENIVVKKNFNTVIEHIKV